MSRKKRAPGAAKGFSRQALYVYILLIGAAPSLAIGLTLTPNHKRARGLEAADTRFTVGYYLTLAGSALGGIALVGLLIDHAGPVGPSRRRSRAAAEEGEDEE